MDKKRLSIVLAAIALAIEATAIVLLVPIVFGPDRSAPDPTTMLLLALVVLGFVPALAGAILRRQAKASTQP